MMTISFDGDPNVVVVVWWNIYSTHSNYTLLCTNFNGNYFQISRGVRQSTGH